MCQLALCKYCAANWHIGILAHYHNYEKNFKDTLDGYLADCSGSRLFLGV